MSPSFIGENLACIRGERLVFSGLNFAVDEGGALLLIGANGSGKTSLLRLLAGLAPPAKGEIYLDGHNIVKDRLSHNSNIHYIAHYDATKADLTVRENLVFWTSMFGGGDVDTALTAFTLQGLADLPARFLSAGQRRRLALARLVAVEVPVWLLDEPTVALDSESLVALYEQISVHRMKGGLAVISTHVELDLSAADTLDVSAYAPRRRIR